MTKMIQKMGILLLIDVVDYTSQSVENESNRTQLFNEHFEKSVRSMAKAVNAFFIKRIGDGVLLFFDTSAGFVKYLDFIIKMRNASLKGKMDKFSFKCKLRMVSHFGLFNFQGTSKLLTDFIGPCGIEVFRMEKLAHEHEVFISHELLKHMESTLRKKEITWKRAFYGKLKGFTEKIRIYKLDFPGEKKGKTQDILKKKIEELKNNCSWISVFGNYRLMRMEDNFINLDIALDEKTFPLSQIESEQGFRFKTPGKGMDSILIRERSEKLCDLDDEQRLVENNDRESKRLNGVKLYEKFRRGMIFGLPGSGKTTTLSYFAFREFQHNNKLDNPDDERLVMFIPCHSIQRYDEWSRKHACFYGKKENLSGDAVESCLYYFLHEFLFHRDVPKLKKQVQRAAYRVLSAFYSGKLTLLVDALDEAHSTDTKEGILNALRILFHECKIGEKEGNRIYITARFSERNRALAEKWQEFQEPVFWVRSLDMEQLRLMAENFYGNGKELYKAFSDAVWKNEIAVKVGGTPLTALLVLVYFEGSRTFDTRFEMYHVLMMFIISRAWKHIKDGSFNRDLKTFFIDVKNGNIFKEEPFIETPCIYDALSLLSYNNMVEEFGDVKGDEILKIFIKFAGDLVGNDKAEAESRKWFWQLKEDHLLIPSGFGEFVFIHMTMMEYLAARFMKEKLKNHSFHQDKFPCDSPAAAIMSGKESFFQSEMIPIAVGSSIETGAGLLRLLKNRVAIERDEKLKEVLYLTSLKCLAEWENYFDRQYLQLRHQMFHSELMKKENENADAVEWIYSYIKEIFESNDQQVLKNLLNKYKAIPRLTRPVLMKQFLSPENFFSGDSELIALRKELLQKFVTGQEADKWYKKDEDEKWKTVDIDLCTFDSKDYHPDDKNFNYYFRYTGPTLCGLLGSPNFKHSHCVTCVAISPDGRTILSGSEDKTIKWWDLETGKEIKTLRGHADYVKSVAFSPDGKTMASGSDDNTVKWWDLESGREMRTLKGHDGTVNCLVFSPDGNTVISGSADNTIKCWDLQTGKETRTLQGHERAVNSIAISTDGRTVISGSDDKTIKYWDLENGQCSRTFTGHTDHVKGAAFCPGGKTIISASWDKAIKSWDLETGEETRPIKGHDQPINSIAVSTDGRFLVSASWDKTIRYWDLKTGKKIRTFVGHTDHVQGVALGPDGKTLVSGSRDNTLRCWNLDSGKEIKTFSGHGTFVNTAAFSPDGQTIISGSRDFTLKWWDLASGKEKQTLMEHRDHVNSVCFCPDGQTVISGSFDKTLKWWDLESGKVIKTFKGHENGIASVCAGSSSKTVISGSFDNTLKLWDLETGKAIRTFKGHQGFAWSIAVSPDDKTVLSGSDDKTLKWWDLDTGEMIKTFTGHEGYVYSVNFSPDGETVVSGSADQTLKLWNLQTGEIIRTFRGHDGIVWSVVFSPDGQYIVSCSWDYTIKIWKCETGECIHTITLLWRPKEIKPSTVRKGFYACANGNGTTALFDFSEMMK